MVGKSYIVPVLLGFFYGSLGLQENPVVNTKFGPIRGLFAKDGDYSMYLGIPYATVNSSNHFGVSIPHPGFESTFDAFSDSAACPQREEFNNTLIGSLDCLKINVYVPNSASSDSKLPVLVHIYGGGFLFGFGGRYQYNPRYLVRHDVIVVTFNYRVGPYGFMCLNTPEVPGNQGIKDQLTALRWVKSNIDAFGGDCDKITVSGQSAGAVSVDFHLIFSKEDLFRNVIIQSGNSLAPFAISVPDRNAALTLSERLGFNTNSTSDALAYLSTIDPLYVVEYSEGSLKFDPCVEQDVGNSDRYITQNPNLAPVPRAKTVPILIGFVNNEVGFLYNEEPPKKFKQFKVFEQVKDYFNFGDKREDEMEKVVRHYYIGDDEMSQNVSSSLVDFAADFNFFYPTYRSIDKYIDNGESTLYFYEFSYDGDRNFMKVKNNNNANIPGALHCDDLGYLFDMAIFKDTPTIKDQLIIDRMTTMWTNFVKYSDPTPKVTGTLPVLWPPIQKDILFSLNIDLDLTVARRPYSDRMAFWDLFFKQNLPYLRIN